MRELVSIRNTSITGQVLIVMQGAPGSGKSTVARILAQLFNATICSTDDFHFDSDGVYRFKPNKIREYHRACARKAFELMDAGKSVIVDNTNTRAWECRDYVRHAQAKTIATFFVRCNGCWENHHGVPDDKVSEMRERMEELTIEACVNAMDPWEKN